MDDFDGEDLFSLALESVEKENPCFKNEKNSSFGKSGSACESSSVNDSSTHQDLSSHDEDVLFSALDEIEKGSVSTPPPQKKIRSLIGVDLRFDEEDITPVEKSTLDKRPGSAKEVSVVHTGDTDSSDDEDNKYFEEARYNPYGKSLKKVLQCNNQNKTSALHVNDYSKGRPLLTKKPQLTEPKQETKVQKIDVTADPVFGIRIINPLVSSQSIRESMQGRTPIGCIKIKSHVQHGDLKSDWVFAAVLVRKFPPKVSQKGNNYSMWVLSDLKNELKTVLLFLFGRSHEELWKTPVGVVLALLNPGVLSDDKSSDYEAKLSIKSPDQVMIWGKSKDLGQCKSRKKNGEICGTFVNLAQCEFCVFHVKQEYKKYNSRPDFGNNGKVNLRNKVLGKNEVFYGGKSFTSTPIVGKKATNPKDKSRLQGLGQASAPAPKERDLQIPNLQRSNEIFRLLPKEPINKYKDANRLNNLFKKTDKTDLKPEKPLKPVDTNHPNNKLQPKLTKTALPIEVSKNPSLKDPGKEICLDIDVSKSNKQITTKKGNKTVNKNPLQARFNGLCSLSSEIGDSRKKSVFLSSGKDDRKASSDPKNSPSQGSPVTIVKPVDKRSINDVSPSVQNNNKTEAGRSPSMPPGALEKIPNIGAQEPPDFSLDSPKINNFQRNKLVSPAAPRNSGMSRAKLRALEFVKNRGPISKENPVGTGTTKKSLKRPFPTDDETENEKPVLSERFMQLMNQKSIHEDLVELRENEQEAEYFEKLEKKDRLEEKMLNTFKVDCKAVRCLKCNYIWFSASDACKAEGHPIKVVDAVKRFFKCGQCDNRTVSLTLIPLIPCKKCYSSKWVRAPMIREKLAKNDGLSIRGGEQKFVNSVTTNGSLNLLVPD